MSIQTLATDVNSHSSSQLQVEDVPQGYPRFASLISTHPSFFICRRFLRLRARLMLHKQNRLAVLEETLDKIDLEEPRVLFLGSQRRDQNSERQSIMEKIEEELAAYDVVVRANREVLGTSLASERDIANLQNWLHNNGSVSRIERRYLQDRTDLMTLGSQVVDGALESMGNVIEDASKLLFRWKKTEYKLSIRSQVSRDEDVYIGSQIWVGAVGRTVMALVLGTAIMVPVVIVDSLHHMIARSVATYLGTTFFIALLALIAKARTNEMFLAGATYATVLTVFMSGNDDACKCQ